LQDRLTKASLAIRNVLASPDIIGIVEVENLKVLQRIADRVNADAVATGQPNPKYSAYLEEGNDFRGIDVGFLVKTAKVKVIETKQLAKDIAHDVPKGSGDEKLFDRPPLMLRAEIADPKTQTAFALSVVVNHFKSYLDVDDEKEGERVRDKRRLQAEWLANFVADRQKADQAENIILCGDFNAFQFHDGYNDLIGILKGKPEPNVLAPSKAVVNTGLANLIDYIEPRNRYSYTYDGSAQALDHILINKPLRDRLLKFGYARLDADFPLIYANDPTRPERISDHDAPVAFFSLDARKSASPPTPKPTL
jgi:predicted extracellular nuclease